MGGLVCSFIGKSFYAEFFFICKSVQVMGDGNRVSASETQWMGTTKAFSVNGLEIDSNLFSVTAKLYRISPQVGNASKKVR